MTVTSLLRKKEPLIQIMVAERCSDPNLRDDALQEGRISIWRESQRGRARTDAYLHTAARTAITHALTRDLWTGRPEGRTAKPVDPMRRPRDSLDALAYDATGGTEPDPMAHHQAEVARAVSALPLEGRQYCFLRFWQGHTNPEAASRLNTNAKTLQNRWLRDYRPALAARLQHLEAA